jgi:uncharacterized protein (DUF58 family)
MSAAAGPGTPQVTLDQLLDPEVFLATDDLELVARGLANSIWLGRHAGVWRGSGVEFHSHRPYASGDDLRRINWTLYARHRRLFTRESRQESLRPVYLLVDATGSMAVAHGRWAKYRYAACLAAGLAHLAAGQGDAPALAILRANISAVSPPRTGSQQAMGICAALAANAASGPGDLAVALNEARELCRRRGFVVLISDFFDKENVLLSELAQLRAQGHDVFAMQILDPMEAELPAAGDFDFIDPETGARLRTSVEEIRAGYSHRVALWREDLRASALTAGIRWRSATTADPIIPLLRDWIGE